LANAGDLGIYTGDNKCRHDATTTQTACDADNTKIWIVNSVGGTWTADPLGDGDDYCLDQSATSITVCENHAQKTFFLTNNVGVKYGIAGLYGSEAINTLPAKPARHGFTATFLMQAAVDVVDNAMATMELGDQVFELEMKSDENKVHVLGVNCRDVQCSTATVYGGCPVTVTIQPNLLHKPAEPETRVTTALTGEFICAAGLMTLRHQFCPLNGLKQGRSN
jgi:hypothetical protein